MKEEKTQLPAEIVEAVGIGMLLGSNQAFGLVAGRCSAAQAAGLKRLREEGKYKAVTPRWREFCSQYLRLSGAEADRIIRLWNEFGAGYFELSQLTRISPQVYRAIAPSIRDGALHTNGEVIELNTENSRRLLAALDEVRRKPAPEAAPALEPHERIALLGERSLKLMEEFEALAAQELAGPNWRELIAIISRMAAALRRLEPSSGLK